MISRLEVSDLSQWSLFRHAEGLFLYCETTGDPPPWGSDWKRLYDIFHYIPDLPQKEWESGRGTPERQLRLVRLKSDRVASYVYWHYLLQEGDRKEPRRKYGMIGLRGNLLAMYTEVPVVYYWEPIALTLTQPQLPEDWQAAMDEHFLPLEPDATSWVLARLVAQSRFNPSGQL